MWAAGCKQQATCMHLLRNYGRLESKERQKQMCMHTCPVIKVQSSPQNISQNLNGPRVIYSPKYTQFIVSAALGACPRYLPSIRAGVKGTGANQVRRREVCEHMCD